MARCLGNTVLNSQYWQAYLPECSWIRWVWYFSVDGLEKPAPHKWHTWSLIPLCLSLTCFNNLLLLPCIVFPQMLQTCSWGLPRVCEKMSWEESRNTVNIWTYVKTVSKWMSLYKWPLYDLSGLFFDICMFIFHKTEVLTVILRCLIGLTYDWFKNYDKNINISFLFIFYSKTDVCRNFCTN